MAGQPDTEADAEGQLRLKDIHAALTAGWDVLQCFSMLSLGKYSFILKCIPLVSSNQGLYYTLNSFIHLVYHSSCLPLVIQMLKIDISKVCVGACTVPRIQGWADYGLLYKLKLLSFHAGWTYCVFLSITAVCSASPRSYSTHVLGVPPYLTELNAVFGIILHLFLWLAGTGLEI